VLLLFVERMRAHDGPAFGLEGLGEGRFHLRLRGPALLVGGQPQITAGHQVNVPVGKGGYGLHIIVIVQKL